jgi:hypothetical protein
MLHLLNKYSKIVVVPKMTSSEGSSFAKKRVVEVVEVAEVAEVAKAKVL